MLVKEVYGLRIQFGGEPHSGWLPKDAALPLPTLVEEEIVDVRIEEQDEGYTLEWSVGPSSANPKPMPPKCGDLWFESTKDAEISAFEMFGIKQDDWQIRHK